MTRSGTASLTVSWHPTLLDQPSSRTHRSNAERCQRTIDSGPSIGLHQLLSMVCRATDQRQLLALLDASRIGVELGDEDQLWPEQSTSAIVLHHPRAKYFVAR